MLLALLTKPLLLDNVDWNHRPPVLCHVVAYISALNVIAFIVVNKVCHVN